LYFSKKPLKIATTFGFSSVALATMLGAWIFYNKIIHPSYLITGWASVILAVMYFGGVQLLTIGILGHYIGSLFDEVKKRPEYIIDEPIQSEQTLPREQVKERPKFLPSLETGTLPWGEPEASGNTPAGAARARETKIHAASDV
jgi:hypothetical protein